MDNQDYKLCAAEIIKQLGGGGFMYMCGVKYPTYDTDKGTPNLSFRFSGSRTANHCEIVLDAMDTYTVTFRKITSKNVKSVKEYTGVYNDMLQGIFKDATGLNTRL